MRTIKDKIESNGGIASVAKAVGISWGYLYKIARGQCTPSPRLAARLARILSISEMEILYPERGNNEGTSALHV